MWHAAFAPEPRRSPPPVTISPRLHVTDPVLTVLAGTSNAGPSRVTIVMVRGVPAAPFGPSGPLRPWGPPGPGTLLDPIEPRFFLRFFVLAKEPSGELSVARKAIPSTPRDPKARRLPVELCTPLMLCSLA